MQVQTLTYENGQFGQPQYMVPGVQVVESMENSKSSQQVKGILKPQKYAPENGQLQQSQQLPPLPPQLSRVRSSENHDAVISSSKVQRMENAVPPGQYNQQAIVQPTFVQSIEV